MHSCGELAIRALARAQNLPGDRPLVGIKPKRKRGRGSETASSVTPQTDPKGAIFLALDETSIISQLPHEVANKLYQLLAWRTDLPFLVRVG